MPSSAKSLLVLGASLLFLTGCLSAGPGAPEATGSGPTAESPDGGVETTQGWHERLENEVDPTRVSLRNDWNRSVDMEVRVVREATGETVYHERHELPAGAERTVFSTARTEADGIESFRVELTARNETVDVGVENSACHGPVVGLVDETGALDIGFVIC
jgi:hypothetical protein